MITICLDFGNTRKKCAIFSGNNVEKTIVFTEDIVNELIKIIDEYKPIKSILSSVINHNIEIEKVLSNSTKFHKLNFESNLPISIPVGKPQTIGADRLAISSAVSCLFANNHTLAIGLGSCITYNFINKFSEFLGGSISPGMMMRFKAMNSYTDLLPIVEATHQFPLIGYDTTSNLQSGVLFGLAKEIDGIIDLYKEKFENLQVVLTGGDAIFFKQHLKSNIIFDDNLLFKGLLAIAKLN